MKKYITNEKKISRSEHSYKNKIEKKTETLIKSQRTFAMHNCLLRICIFLQNSQNLKLFLGCDMLKSKF